MKMSALTAITIAAGLAVSSPVFAATMTDAECSAAWTKADTDGNGVLTNKEGGRYYAAMRVADKPIEDGKLTRAMFLESCKSGAFVVAAVDPSAPLAGANSFTERQAADRAMMAGLNDVIGLKKDDKGVWRGKAMDGQKAVDVAVDFKGNVVVK